LLSFSSLRAVRDVTTLAVGDVDHAFSSELVVLVLPLLIPPGRKRLREDFAVEA